MSEQLQLFKPERPVWIDRIWQRIDPERRQELVAILAQMATDALIGSVPSQAKEGSDES